MYHVTLTVRIGTEENGLPIVEEVTEEVHGEKASDAVTAAKAAEKRWAVRVDKVVPGPDPEPGIHPDQQRLGDDEAQ